MERLDFGPEFRLLIDCSIRAAGRGITPESINDRINWTAFLSLVRRHHFAPIAWRGLSSAGSPSIPAQVLEELQRRAHRAWLRAIQYAAATLELTNRFEEHGIQTIALKGAGLSYRLFGDPALREVRDVDLLVRPAAMAYAEELLLSHGFKRLFPKIDLTPRMWAVLLCHSQHFEYSDAAGTRVELHWRVESWDDAAVEWLWTHRERRAWPGGVVAELDDVALALFLIDHGARHRWFRLKWLADAAQFLMQRQESEMPALVDAARALGRLRPLAQAVLLVQTVCGLPIPPALVSAAGTEPHAWYLLREAVGALRGSEHAHFGGHSVREWFRNRRYARCLLGPAGGTCQLLRAADFEEVSLPDSLFWLYYPLRPLLWLRRRLSSKNSSDREFERAYFSGAVLYGDDFDDARVRAWYQREERAYFDMAAGVVHYTYGHEALNRHHFYRFLPGRYPTCLAFGCARGDDVAPLAASVDRFIAIEPAEGWWSGRINGTAAQYRKPAPSGNIPMDSGSADLVVCFSALHHIANASHVFSEFVRVLRPGGLLLIREPVCTMGDWRKPRRGLTLDERGFPPGWLDDRAAELGLQTVRKANCGFPLMSRLAWLLRLGAPYNIPMLVRVDACISWLLRWNLHYHRDTIFKKFAPAEIACIYRKREATAATYGPTAGW